jgi:hypothetical protein
MLTRFSALAAAVLATMALTPAPKTQLHSFQTPSRNIACMAVEDAGEWSLRCDIAEKDWRGASAGPDCELDSGDALGLGATGRAYWVCHGDTVLGEGAVLSYGRQWRVGPFTCTPTPSNLTCRNGAQHGFVLSRASYRLF